MSRHENLAHEETYRGCKIKLVYDEHAQSPREGYDLGTMVCWHRRYNLGDEQPEEDAREWFRDKVEGGTRWNAEKERREQEVRARYAKEAESGFTTPEQHEDHEEHLNDELDDVKRVMEGDSKLIRDLFDKDHVRLPLYLYDHSGITMSTGKFSCPWDSGQVGFIYCPLEKAKKEFPSFKIGTGWDAQSDDIRYAGKTLRQAVAECLEAEVKNYDAYLTGQVVGYVT